MKLVIMAAVAAPVLLGGCVSTVTSVVKAPFRVAAQATDWATTSQDEADRNRGRKLRKHEAQAYRACKRYQDQSQRAQCMNARLNR